jgi:hypothetical protein
MGQQRKWYATNEAPSFDNNVINALPNSHPLGLGFGAASGGMVGAAIGSAVAGPAGAAVGAVFGGVLGACGGQGIARAVNNSDGVCNIEELDDCLAGDADTVDVYKYADEEYGHIRDACARAHEDSAALATPWDQLRPFSTRGWGRLSGVIGPRDTDRGLRGGI